VSLVRARRLCCLAFACLFVPAVVRAQPPDILISRQALRDAHLSIGDTVTLSNDASGAGGRTFRVAGVYEPTPDPMRFNAERLEVRMHLDDVLAFRGRTEADSVDAISAINLKPTSADDAARLSADLVARYPLLLVRSTARAGDDTPFAVLDRFHLAIAIVTVIGSTAFLLALMVIRAEERRETIGMLRLIGISTRSILLEVVVEGLAVALAGAVFGIVLAWAAQFAVNGFFQARYDTTLVFVRVTLPIALRAMAIAVPVGVVAGAAASWTVLRRRMTGLIRR
jgi:ABC-type antimicrobial peptide transport system permease subunit